MPKNTLDAAESLKSPRVLKSHLPAHLIPKQIWEKKSKERTFYTKCRKNSYKDMRKTLIRSLPQKRFHIILLKTKPLF